MPLAEEANGHAPEAVDLWLPRVFRLEPDLPQIVQQHLQLMPLGMRLRHWAALRGAGRAPSAGLLLPEWLGSAVDRLRPTRRR